MATEKPSRRNVDRQRWVLLHHLEGWLEIPMILLGFVWLALLIWELVVGLTPLLSLLGRAIWILFIVDFLLRVFLAPTKLRYIKRNWLTAIALMIPALRTLRLIRVFRILRLSQRLNLLRVLTSFNRGMKALRKSIGRRGFGYVVLLTLLVTVSGAAGMYAFERGTSGFTSYSETLWWTAMIVTSIGSEAWPQTPEGRLLCFFLSLYGLAILGYVAATLASFFIDRDVEELQAGPESKHAVTALHQEIQQLREEIRQLRQS